MFECVIVLCVSFCAGGIAYKYQMLLHLLTFFITDCKLVVCFVQLLLAPVALSVSVCVFICTAQSSCI